MTEREATIPPQHRPTRRGRSGRALGSLLAVAVLLLLVRGRGLARLLPHAAVGVPVAARGGAGLSGAAGTVAPRSP